MDALTLSRRLQTVAAMIPHGKRLADIGSDHAYLPCYAYLHGLVPCAIAGDVADGPYRAASRQVKELELGDVITVRKGDGLDILSPGEVDVVVIAGMGGSLIADILDDGKQKLAGVSTLILQPNTAEDHVRHWLMTHDWELMDEAILEEKGRIYEVMAAQPGDGYAPYRMSGEAGLWAGPFLLEEKNAAFRKKWQSEVAKWKRVEKQLDRASQTEEIAARKRNIRKKRKETEEILNG